MSKCDCCGGEIKAGQAQTVANIRLGIYACCCAGCADDLRAALAKGDAEKGRADEKGAAIWN